MLYVWKYTVKRTRNTCLDRHHQFHTQQKMYVCLDASFFSFFYFPCMIYTAEKSISRAKTSFWLRGFSHRKIASTSKFKDIAAHVYENN